MKHEHKKELKPFGTCDRCSSFWSYEIEVEDLRSDEYENGEVPDDIK